VTAPPWLALFATLPADQGECERVVMTGTALEGWEQLRCVLSDGGTNMRVVVAMYDPEGRPSAVTDLIASAGGYNQETVGARVEPDGQMQGTGWRTEGGQHTPRALTEADREGLLAVAEALRRRCSGRLER